MRNHPHMKGIIITEHCGEGTYSSCHALNKRVDPRSETSCRSVCLAKQTSCGLTLSGMCLPPTAPLDKQAIDTRLFSPCVNERGRENWHWSWISEAF